MRWFSKNKEVSVKVPDSAQVSVLFVCMGNICRSPTAEGVFRRHVQDAGLAEKIFVDSAGTHAYHVGNPADHRAAAAAVRRGYTLSGIKARKVSADDFSRFDLVLAMDEDNLSNLHEVATAEHRAKVQLFLRFGSKGLDEVPDPYYGGAGGFEHVLDLVEDASNGLLAELQKRIGGVRSSET
ncbi:MAG: low molecular weight phosphotyrosine protein phosphatase [Woeseia sp.]|nr:low molecular weight phosphotyrosine protein phosphatase [Woeseia sp.]MBT8097084.1 low molecular weight phosphotyrosine protein phosphatase [Woeseia sp.]NNE62060.1 low molecular weight phosphotyrosine protein phosphatase [Woeseia sp.]NNL53671.1 low molecular weight phosphotyrosine protein phosphatase [Woeseia sp.]